MTDGQHRAEAAANIIFKLAGSTLVVASPFGYAKHYSSWFHHGPVAGGDSTGSPRANDASASGEAGSA